MTLFMKFADGSIDVVVSSMFLCQDFNPEVVVSEVWRVLKPGGQVIVVGPDALHLDGLKRLIYDHNQPHQGNFGPMTQSPYFTLQSATKLQKFAKNPVKKFPLLILRIFSTDSRVGNDGQNLVK